MTNDCTQVYKLADKDDNVLYSGSDDMSVEKRPEIARNKLNQLLCDQISPSSIQWRRKLSSARCFGKDQQSVELDFGQSNGKKTFDLVIGADGAWSKIRSLVTDVKPKFVNQHYITTSIRNISSTYPHHTSRRSFALFPSQIYQRGRTCLPRMLQAEEQERPVQNHLYELPSPVQR